MPMNIVIQEKRRELGLTQEQVAECLGVTAPAVNKWEKGVSCPDISLVPALARLLKIDLNTLFCFQENLSEQEIGRFSQEVAGAIREHGTEAGFALAEEQIQSYPNCDSLLHTLTLLLEGSLIMSGMPQDQKDMYQEKLTGWYERAAGSSDEKIRNSALFMLAGKYLRQEDCRKAQETIDLLPERSAMDKRLFQADIYMQQGKKQEAAVIMERLLLSSVNELQGILLRLTEIELKAGEGPTARAVAEVSRRAAELFDLWEYNAYVAPLEVALTEENEDESLRLIKCLLDAVYLPWNMKASPLYHRIAREHDDRMRTIILPPLLAELENNPRYEFLRPKREFQELLAKYRRSCK